MQLLVISAANLTAPTASVFATFSFGGTEVSRTSIVAPLAGRFADTSYGAVAAGTGSRGSTRGGDTLRDPDAHPMLDLDSGTGMASHTWPTGQDSMCTFPLPEECWERREVEIEIDLWENGGQKTDRGNNLGQVKKSEKDFASSRFILRTGYRFTLFFVFIAKFCVFFILEAPQVYRSFSASSFVCEREPRPQLLSLNPSPQRIIFPLFSHFFLLLILIFQVRLSGDFVPHIVHGAVISHPLRPPREQGKILNSAARGSLSVQLWLRRGGENLASEFVNTTVMVETLAVKGLPNAESR